MWCRGLAFNSLACTSQGGVYNETGEYRFVSSTITNVCFPHWQVTRVAAERSAQKRLEYVTRIGEYQADQLIFVDESSVDRRTTYRGRAWSIRGTKAQRKAFFVRGRRSVHPSLCLNILLLIILQVFRSPCALVE